MARNVPEAGSPETSVQPRIVTVLVALTQPEYQKVAEGTEPFGTPIDVSSPSAAPVTVMVKSSQPTAAKFPKSSVAVAEITFRMGVPPPIVVLPTVIGASAESSARRKFKAVAFLLIDGKLEVVPPNCKRVKSVPALFVSSSTPSEGV